MPIPNSPEPLGRFVVARIKEEVFAVQAGIECSSCILSSVAQELGLSYTSRDASVTIEVGKKKVAMVIAVSPYLDQDLVLGTDFLYLLDFWA